MKTFTFALTFFSMYAFAAIRLTEDTVVKVISRPCKSSLHTFKGSGLLFEHAGQTYVVTSEHVLYHDNEKHCHAVMNDRLENTKAFLLRADWGIGLALLRLEDTPSFSVPQLSDLKGTLLRSGDPAVTLGYPFESDALLIGSQGQIATTKSKRALIPMNDSMIEVTQAHVEFGMSGGILTSPDHTKLLGLLSHQFLKQVAGRGAVVQEMLDPSSPAADHVFVIPADTVYQWLHRILDLHENSVPTIVRNADSQGELGSQSVFANGLEFSASRLDPTLPPVGGAEGVGGYRQEPIEVSLNIDRKNHLAELGLPAKRQEWLLNVKSQLVRQKEVSIPYFVRLDQRTQEIQKVSMHSVPEFFKYLKDPALDPVTVIQGKTTYDKETEKNSVEILLRSGNELIKKIHTLESQTPSKPLPQEASGLLHQIKVMADILVAENWKILPSTWPEMLMNGHKEGWIFLFNQDFTTTQEIMTQLLGIQAAMVKLKV